jgi:hypothetical protein
MPARADADWIWQDYQAWTNGGDEDRTDDATSDESAYDEYDDLNVTELEDRIHLHAYYIWLGEGKPEGRHLVHWEAAREAIAEGELRDKISSVGIGGRCWR